MLVIRQVPAEQFQPIFSRLAQAFPQAELRCLLSPAEADSVPAEARIIFDPKRDRFRPLLRHLRSQKFLRAAWAAEPGDRRPRALVAEMLIASLGVREKLTCFPNRPWRQVGRWRALAQPFGHALEAAALCAVSAAAAGASFALLGGAALLSDLVAWLVKKQRDPAGGERCQGS